MAVGHREREGRINEELLSAWLARVACRASAAWLARVAWLAPAACLALAACASAPPSRTDRRDPPDRPAARIDDDVQLFELYDNSRDWGPSYLIGPPYHHLGDESRIDDTRSVPPTPASTSSPPTPPPAPLASEQQPVLPVP